MTTPPIQIRKDDVVRDIRELASLTHSPITEAVAIAVQAALVRARREQSQDVRRAAVREAVQRFHDAPAVGPMLADADLYDETGLPR